MSFPLKFPYFPHQLAIKVIIVEKRGVAVLVASHKRLGYRRLGGSLVKFP